MSGVTDSVALPMLVVGVPLAVAGAALAGVGMAAFAIANQMQQDYQTALEEFNSKAQEEFRRRSASNLQHSAAATAATSALVLAQYASGEDATSLFLTENIARLLERARSGQSADLIAACQELQAAVQQSSADTAVLLDRFFTLSEKVITDAVRTTSPVSGRKASATEALQQALTDAHAEIHSPLLNGRECNVLRAQLQAQWEALQPLIEREPTLLAQGITLLRQRIQREVKRQAEYLRQREHEAAHWRSSINDMLAKLYAVSRQQSSLQHAQRSEGILKHLSEALAVSHRADGVHITALKEQTDALFVDCAKSLQDQALIQYIGAEVTDVLLSLGYKVLQIEGEEPGQGKTCMATLEGSIGLQFRADAQGRLATEMVALTEQAAQVDPAAQERVCRLVDEVFQSLKKRQFKVREKTRRTLPREQRLRVVSVPIVQTQTAAQVTAVPQAQKRVQP